MATTDPHQDPVLLIEQLRVEIRQQLAEVAHRHAEARKFDAEARKTDAERVWYPFVVAAGLLGSGSALTFLILGVAKALGLSS